MRRFITHVLRFSGESRAVPKNLGKKGKETGLEFYRGYGVGLG